MALTAEWAHSPVETHTQAVMHEPVKLTPSGELGDGCVVALQSYRASCDTPVVMYSHASFH